MQATQSNNASDLLHPETTDLSSTPAGGARNAASPPPSASTTPIFLGPIQAARKYMERQRNGGCTTEVTKSELKAESIGSGGSRTLSGSISGLYNRQQATREQDRRLERSLYEGHSIEAGLNYEPEAVGEDLSSTTGIVSNSLPTRRAFLSTSDGTERPFPYAQPHPRSSALESAVPAPGAVREAIIRLARESRPMDPSNAGPGPYAEGYFVQDRSITSHRRSPTDADRIFRHHMDAQTELLERSETRLPSASSPRLSMPAPVDAAAPPVPAFADVAKQVWALGSSESGTPAASTEVCFAAQRDLKVKRDAVHADAHRGHWTDEDALSVNEEHLGLAREDRVTLEDDFSAPLPITFRQEQEVTVAVSGPVLAADPVSVMGMSAFGLEAPVSQTIRHLPGQSSLERHEEKFEDAALAHDASNLLSALGLYSDLLNVPGVLDDLHHHYAEELKLIAARSQTLIDRLLRLRNPSETNTRLGEPGAAAPGTINNSTFRSDDMQQGNAEPQDLELPQAAEPERELRDPGLLVFERREIRTLASAQRDTPVTQPLDPSGQVHLQLGQVYLQPAVPSVPDVKPLDAQEPVAASLMRIMPHDYPAVMHVGPPSVSTDGAGAAADRPSSLEDSRPGAAASSENILHRSSLEIDAQRDLQIDVREGVSSQTNREAPKTRQKAQKTGQKAPSENGLIASPETPLAIDVHSEAMLLSSGAQGSKAWPTSLVDLLMRWGSLLSTLAHGTLDISFGPQAATPVAIDAESLERILVNLVKNARAATIEGGAIRIGVRGCDVFPMAAVTEATGPEARYSGAPSGHQRSVILTVDDSGCGMSEWEVMQLLTAEEASGQVNLPLGSASSDSSLKDMSAGTVAATAPAPVDHADRAPRQGRGLGLRVVRRLVAGTGGTLAIQSRLGRGTRVEIRWPSASAVSAGELTAMAEQGADILSGSATALKPLSKPSRPIPADPSLPTTIGPDGFSEQELRSMMLRLHRTAPSSQGYVQSLLERRQAAPEVAADGDVSGFQPETHPSASRVPERFGPRKVLAEQQSASNDIYSANPGTEVKGAIAC